MFNSFNTEEGQIKKIIQYLVQGRDLEASSFGNTKLVAEIKKYLNQIPTDKMEVLKKKKGEEIQNIFSGDSLKKLIDYLKKQNLM
jgi:hypothetical protein